jgi:hypothetical protein
MEPHAVHRSERLQYHARARIAGAASRGQLNYRQQESKRLCEQQNDPALRMRCEQQVNNEFQKYRHEQRKSKDE